jgi:hypothetical protein
MIDLIPYFAGLITILFSTGFYFAIKQPKTNK